MQEPFFLTNIFLCSYGNTELVRRDRREEVLNFTLLCALQFHIVLFQSDQTRIEEGTFAMGEDHTSDLLILHIVLHELSDEFFTHFYIIRRTKKRREGL